MSKLHAIAGAWLLSFSLSACGVAPPAPAAYPGYNSAPLPADKSGMASDAVTLAARIKAGYNIGNTLEATGGETHWGNPNITPQFLRLIRHSGFTAVRLPTAWSQYADKRTGKISDAWLARVQQVVRDCVDNDLYVIVNIHWDGGWLDEHIDRASQAAVNARQKAYWEQIATALRDFDEHVLFAGANEPPARDAAQMAVLLSYHQTFIDAVRATGGRNAYRVLVVQGPQTDIELTDKLMDTMPTDTVPGRLMAEVHYYTPYQFTLMEADATWGKQFYYWGAGYHSTTDTAHNATAKEEAALDAYFASMKTRFVDKGIPVILGEFGAMRRSGLPAANRQLHLDSRAHFLNYASRRAMANGMLPFYWDNGVSGPNGWAIFNRHANTVADGQALDALIRGAHGQGLDVPARPLTPP